MLKTNHCLVPNNMRIDANNLRKFKHMNNGYAEHKNFPKQKKNMKLSDYQELIQQLPVLQHSVQTERVSWSKYEHRSHFYRKINDDIFSNQANASFSRSEILKEENLNQRIFKTIYWGYPKGMRGNNFEGILENYELVVRKLAMIKNENISEKKFFLLLSSLSQVKGLGLSTLSKLLYFFEVRIEGNPCIILDRVLIKLLQSNAYEELYSMKTIKYGRNAENNYVKFLNLIQAISEKNNFLNDQLEFFLFVFGSKLKEQNQLPLDLRL